MAGCNKRTRARKTSSGKRRAGRTGKNLGRRSSPIADPVKLAFLKGQDNGRWPSDETCDKYAKLNREKKVKGRPGKNLAPLGFPLMEAAMAHGTASLEKLLIAASLKVKRVKRHPGWVLQRTYNLKNRIIEIV